MIGFVCTRGQYSACVSHRFVRLRFVAVSSRTPQVRTCQHRSTSTSAKSHETFVEPIRTAHCDSTDRVVPLPIVDASRPIDVHRSSAILPSISRTLDNRVHLHARKIHTDVASRRVQCVY
jgi:hypothetical protein